MECPWERLWVRGAAGDRSGQWSCWRRWDWTSLHLDQVRVAEVGDVDFPKAAIAGHNLGGVCKKSVTWYRGA